jgi:hypothetical protein
MKKLTRQDVFEQFLTLLDTMTVAALQGVQINPQILYLLNEAIGLLMDNPEEAAKIEKMMDVILKESLEVENIEEAPAAPVIPINKKLN